jgi:hypothetical protein
MGASFGEFFASDHQASVLAVLGKPFAWRYMHSSTRRLDAAQSKNWNQRPFLE